MSRYEVIKRIMESTKLNEEDKVYKIALFLKGWLSVEQLSWIWE